MWPAALIVFACESFGVWSDVAVKRIRRMAQVQAGFGKDDGEQISQLFQWLSVGLVKQCYTFVYTIRNIPFLFCIVNFRKI